MAVSHLSGRLARIRSSQKKVEKKQNDGRSAELTGWENTAPYLYERITSLAFTGCREIFSSYLPLLFPGEKNSVGSLISENRMLKSLVFFDLETTGLSHGAGTVAFMAGIARFVPDTDEIGKNLQIHQILLSDYPGEITFLSRFIELAGDNPVFVSFNGKCFDSQILFTRFMMNGLKPSFLTHPATHLDLLFPSRRLWKKKLGSCRLSVIESEILGVTRFDDLPGSEAPDAWFDYVRSGITARLLAIGDHNRTDCESLARLLFALDDAIDKGEGRSALIRALDLRIQKDYKGSSRFLSALANEGDIVALKILAIDAEHRLFDFEQALEFAEKLGDENRKSRIQKKIGRIGL